MASAVSCAASPSRSLTTTLAPCSDSSSAVALPIPRALPVTIATLSSRTPITSPCRYIRGPEILLADRPVGARVDGSGASSVLVAQGSHGDDRQQDRRRADQPHPPVVLAGRRDRHA